MLMRMEIEMDKMGAKSDRDRRKGLMGRKGVWE